MAFTDQPERYGGGFVAAIVGYGASRLLGASFWVPAVLCAVAYAALARWWPRGSLAMRWAVALLIGQCAWMLLGVLLAPQMLLAVAFDIAAGVGFGLWILISLKRVPVALLMLLQGIGLIFNALLLNSLAEQGSVVVTALVMHIALRIGIIAAAAIALKAGLASLPEGDEALDEVFS